jgi:hypothetical protein
VRGAQPGSLGGDQVVVAVVTDVDDLLRAPGGRVDDAAEERGIGLGGSPLRGRGDEVRRQAEPAEDAAGSGGLVPGDTDPQANSAQPGQGRPDVGVQVGLGVVLAGPGLFPALSLAGQVEAGTEVLEGLGVVPPGCGHGSQHGGERVTGHADPVCPRAELPAVVQQRLPDIEDHRDHGHFRSPSRHLLTG